MATLFVLILFLAVIGMFGLEYLSHGGPRNRVPQKVHMRLTHLGNYKEID